MSDDNPVLEQQTYLAVPYDKKEQAQQSLGQLANGLNAAGFDSDNGLWFAKIGTPISKVEPWLPNPNQFRQPTHQDPTLELASVLESAGLVLNDAPIFDGAIHRVSTVDDKSGKKSGVYAAYNDGHPSGWYQDHRNHSEPQKWHASFEQSDPIAKLHLKAHQANQRSLREITEHKRYAHHAKRSAQAFNLMQPATTNHPYLTRKDVQVFPDVGQDKKGRLVVPLMDENNKVHSLQRISGNGFKSLKKGAQKSDHFFVVGFKPLTNGEPILYAEGYSTAASIAEATGRSVVMTVDAGNMPKVAAKLKQHYPESQHLFLADDDHKNKMNKGLDKAREAAEITDGHWLTPSFIVDEREHGMTDFNDLHVSRGLNVVKSQIDEFMERCTPAAVALIQAEQIDKAASEPTVTKATLNTIEQYVPITESSEIPKDKDANSYLNNQLSGVKEVTTSTASDTEKLETKSPVDRTPSVNKSQRDEKTDVINNQAKPDLPSHLAATYIAMALT
ncbi:MAG: hypothetical protein HAW66_04845 [Shewanella sp.]|nr:hypothetical protein [Shewanella sp.]